MRRTLAVVCAGLVMGSGLSMSGCSGNNSLESMMMNSAAEKAMATLPDSVKAMATQYTTGLTQLVQMLMNVQSTRDALGAVRPIEPLIEQVTKASSGLKALDPETKQNVLTAFEPQLKTSNQGFMDQLNRIRGDASGGIGSMGQLLGPALDRISLFK